MALFKTWKKTFKKNWGKLLLLNIEDFDKVVVTILW